MNEIQKSLLIVASVLFAVTLSGCGGSGGGGTAPPGDEPAAKRMPKVSPPLEEADEEMRLAGEAFAVRQAALRRDFGDPPSTTKADESEFQVTKVSGDGNDGFHVTYTVAGGEERTVHFTAGDFEAGDCRNEGCYYVENDGERFWLWNPTRSFAETPRVDYFDVLAGSFPGGYRANFAYGIHTESTGLPAGTATYVGWMHADTYRSDDPSNGQRVDVDGRLKLTADFAASTLGGRIDLLRTRSRDDDGNRLPWKDLPDTTWFDISNGSIADAEFAADLTGMDGGADPALVDTVQGYTGEVLGGFYGPSAEEVGGVVHASSPPHGRVMLGYLAGERLNPRVPPGALSVQSVAVDRDYSAPSTSLTDTAEVTMVASDGAGGYQVTYNVGGNSQVVTLGVDDYGSNPAFRDIFSERLGNRSYHLFEYTNSFFGPPEFDHFNVEGWSVADWNATQTDMLDAVKSGFVVYGTPTEVADLPSGTASYRGRVEGEIWSMDAAARPEAILDFFLAAFNLEADFATSTVGGMIDDIRLREPGDDDHSPVDVEVAIENGVIADSGFTADLSSPQLPNFTGDMTGQFFGPGAAEVGGVFSGTDPDENEVIQAWFGGTKQP